MTPTVPDGPDSELAEAIANLRRGTEVRLAALEEGRVSIGTGRFLATIVRAVLARPAAGRDLTVRDVAGAVNAWNRGSYKRAVVEHLNGIARPAVARTDGQPPAGQEGHRPFQVDETIRLEGTIARLRESLADVPAAIATVRDVWANGSPEARGFLRLPDAGSWPDLARALDTLCAISAGQKGREHRAYEEWAAAQDADGQPPAQKLCFAPLPGQPSDLGNLVARCGQRYGHDGRHVPLAAPADDTAPTEQGGGTVPLRGKQFTGWNYRVVKLTQQGETLYGIHEAYYGPLGWTANPVAPVAESLAELRDVLAKMAVAPELEVIDGGEVEAPADDTAAPAAPRADWSGAWAELTGYVRAATGPIDPTDLDAYMVELKREALRPFREWLGQLGSGQPVRGSQPEATVAPVPRLRRLRACVEAWPEAADGGYDPRCCRFPKSCSASAYDPDRVAEDALEPLPARPVRDTPTPTSGEEPTS